MKELLSERVGKEDSIGASEIGLGHGEVSFLACSVKNIEFDNKIVDFEHFGEEVDAGGGFGIGEGVVDVLVEDGGFAGV